MKTYDYLIVGAGLTGCMYAYLLGMKNKRCLVIDASNSLGGGYF